MRRGGGGPRGGVDLTMPTFRIYYAERELNEASRSGYRRTRDATFHRYDNEAYRETEWEEEVEAKDKVSAVEAFFRERVRDHGEVRWIDDEGASHAIEGVSDYNPDLTYIWVENDKLMEYQGLDEATAGMVGCPMCDGSGEVDAEVADEYLSVWGQEIEEE